MVTHFELVCTRRHHNNCTGEKGNRENHGGHSGRDHTVVKSTIHSSNTPHHWLKSSFQVSTAALHIILGYSMVRSGKMMRISAQNPCETGNQIIQDNICHKFSGFSHKAVVEVQWETTFSYWNCITLLAVPKTTKFSQTSLWAHRKNTSAFTVIEVTWNAPWGAPWTSSLWASM